MQFVARLEDTFFFNKSVCSVQMCAYEPSSDGGRGHRFDPGPSVLDGVPIKSTQFILKSGPAPPAAWRPALSSAGPGSAAAPPAQNSDLEWFG